MPSTLEWESALAALSLAGVNIQKQTSISVATASEGTYTLTEQPTKRAILFHTAANDDDIRFALNATASATSFPIASSVYFAVAAEVDDVLHVYNAAGSSVTVHILEVR